MADTMDMEVEPSVAAPTSATVTAPNPTAHSLVGTYNFQSSENVDEYLKALGVGLVLRKVNTVARPSCIISYEAMLDQWTITVESVFKKREITFSPLEKFEDETFDVRKCQSRVEVTENGGVMKWAQICQEGPDVEVTMTGTEVGFSWVMSVGENRCELKFIRVPRSAVSYNPDE